jgi:hypothetical protein
MSCRFSYVVFFIKPRRHSFLEIILSVVGNPRKLVGSTLAPENGDEVCIQFALILYIFVFY